MQKEETKFSHCGCCSELVEVPIDTCDEDVYCKQCMGDPEAKRFKAQIGWAGRMFYEARFDIIRKKLKPENQAKWDKLSYERKCSIIGKAIQKGLMI